jgi:NTE family protein
MTSPHAETAVVLSGGGARAAYQIGALRAVARILKRQAHSPFGVITGTSAGAINAAALAAHADNWRRGVARALRLWRNITVDDVYEAELASVAGYGMRWLASVLVGGQGGPAEATSMLDNAPLRGLLERALDMSAVPARVLGGQLSALAINATSYTTGHAVSFFDGAPSLAPWRRTRRRGERAVITIDHLLASTAIPFVFPSVRIAMDYYADGSMRQIAPLSPALHLGARRILVVAVGQFAGQRPPLESLGQPASYPSFAQVAGHALTSIFLDNLGADLERMLRLNQVLNLVPPALRAQHPEVAHVDALLLAPSRDLGRMAVAHADRLPTGVRYLLHGLGGTEGTGANLLSYLLFDWHYCRELIALGFSDAMTRRDEIAAFLGGDGANFLPIMPPELLT